MQSVIVGMGEVGKALGELFESSYHYDTSWDLDVSSLAAEINQNGDPVVLHIAFPFNRDFMNQVRHYENLFKRSYTVIHSTVPIGTCRQLGAYHSPVRGVHPHIAESMRTFVTYLAPNKPLSFGDGAGESLLQYMENAGFKIQMVDDSDDTEAGKLWSLAAYAVSITLEKQVYEHCMKNGLDFDMVYRDFTETYNSGYNSMGHPEYTRPVLKPMEGPIGGHCIIPGVRMLDDGGLLDVVQVENDEPVRV